MVKNISERDRDRYTYDIKQEICLEIDVNSDNAEMYRPYKN